MSYMMSGIGYVYLDSTHLMAYHFVLHYLTMKKSIRNSIAINSQCDNFGFRPYKTESFISPSKFYNVIQFGTR